jgi:hypothetical protein
MNACAKVIKNVSIKSSRPGGGHPKEYIKLPPKVAVDERNL